MPREDFQPYNNLEEALRDFNERITNNFEFLNHQQQTGFHEVDIKRYETRVCVALNCGITAIVMVGVLLEEFLKTLLKYKFIFENRDESIEPSLDEVEKSSLAAEANFGFFKLHNAIEKSKAENLITDEEKTQLMGIKENIRNAFIHSDKSLMFDNNKKGSVTAVKLEFGDLVIKERKDMSALALIFAQGILQKDFANREAMNIFKYVDSLTLQINDRFWKEREKS